MCATTTLAMGVNLPAHLVIVKGTQVWRGGGGGSSSGYQEMSPTVLQQMVGRAGRPGYDTHGVAVIMTKRQHQATYQNLGLGLEPAESALPGRLVEILNAEIAQGVVGNVAEAVAWLKSTFFFRRVVRNPAYYQYPRLEAEASPRVLEARLKQSVCDRLGELAEGGALAYAADDDGFSFASTPDGRIMSVRLVTLSTLRCVTEELPPTAPLDTVLSVLCAGCSELATTIRHGQKGLLNAMNKHPRMRFPIKGKCQRPEQKAYILAQAALGGGIEIADFNLRKERDSVAENLTRILLAVQDHAARVEAKGPAALAATLLLRSARLSRWETEALPLSQLDGIGAKLASNLQEQGVTTFAEAASTTAYSLECMAGRRAPFGAKLRNACRAVVAASLTATVKVAANKKGAVVVVAVGRAGAADGAEDAAGHQAAVPSSLKQTSYVLVAYQGTRLMAFRRLRKADAESTHTLPIVGSQGSVHVALICTSLVGLDERFDIGGPSKTESGGGEAAAAVRKTASPKTRKKAAPAGKRAAAKAPAKADTDGAAAAPASAKRRPPKKKKEPANRQQSILDMLRAIDAGGSSQSSQGSSQSLAQAPPAPSPSPSPPAGPSGAGMGASFQASRSPLSRSPPAPAPAPSPPVPDSPPPPPLPRAAPPRKQKRGANDGSLARQQAAAADEMPSPPRKVPKFLPPSAEQPAPISSFEYRPQLTYNEAEGASEAEKNDSPPPSQLQLADEALFAQQHRRSSAAAAGSVGWSSFVRAVVPAPLPPPCPAPAATVRYPQQFGYEAGGWGMQSPNAAPLPPHAALYTPETSYYAVPSSHVSEPQVPDPAAPLYSQEDSYYAGPPHHVSEPRVSAQEPPLATPFQVQRIRSSRGVVLPALNSFFDGPADGARAMETEAWQQEPPESGSGSPVVAPFYAPTPQLDQQYQRQPEGGSAVPGEARPAWVSELFPFRQSGGGGAAGGKEGQQGGAFSASWALPAGAGAAAAAAAANNDTNKTAAAGESCFYDRFF